MSEEHYGLGQTNIRLIEPYLGEADPEKFRAYGKWAIELPGQLKVESRFNDIRPLAFKDRDGYGNCPRDYRHGRGK